MKTRLVDIDNAIHRTNSKLEDLNQGVGSATTGLKDLEHMVSTGLYKTAEVRCLICPVIFIVNTFTGVSRCYVSSLD